MSDRLVRVDVADGVRTLTLDSPHNRNALSRQLVTELLEGLEGAADDDATRVMVLAAQGKAFCAGADLKEMTSGGDDARAQGTAAMLRVFRAILASPCPVVARVHAPVRAGGTGIVAACDVAVASTEATFSIGEARLALAPAMISLVVQPRMTSRAASRTWLTGEQFDGAAAADHGLVTTACAPDELDGEVEAVVGGMLQAHPQGLAATKQLLNRAVLADLDARGDELAALSAGLFSSDAAQGIMRAFLSR